MSQTKKKSSPQTQYLANYKPADFEIKQVHLDFSLFENQTIVTSKLAFKKINKRVKNLQLVGEQLTLVDISIDQQAVTQYETTEDSLIVKQVPDEFTLSTQVIIHPEKNTLLSGLYRSNGIFCTQCEAEGFRRITYFLDRPDVMTTYRVRLEADKALYPVLLSNGNLIEEGNTGHGRHYAIWDDPFAKPSYLFALVAGDLAKVSKTTQTQSNRDVLLEVYTEKPFIHQADYALGALERSLKWDESTFNLEYDLDRYMIVAISDFNAGAMENKGLNIFNTKYVLATPETATDTDFFNIENVIGHEYFHNWSGNRVTCRDWFQLSLKEGLTVFRDSLFSADMTTKGFKRLEEVRTLRDHQFLEDQGPMSHPVRPDNYIEINNFYTLTVYEKGGEVIRMMYQMMGETLFKKGLALYFERHDGQAVTIEDFAQAMSDASGIDFMGQFFLWYTQSGTPIVSVSSEYDDQSKTYKFHCQQINRPTAGQSEKHPLVIPLSYRLFSESGQSLCDERTVILDSEQKTIEFGSINQRPVLSFLRNFSAPVIVEYDAPISDWHTLLKHDDDLFVRFDAMQSLLKSAINHATDAESSESEAFNALCDSLQQIISDEQTPVMEKAELLSLPSLGTAFNLLPDIEISTLANTLRQLKKRLATQLKPALLDCLSAKPAYAEDDLSFSAMSERKLRNACLQILANTEDEAIISLAKAQYDTSNCMTNRLGALNALNQSPSDERKAALADFYQRFSDDPQVLDKWLSIQATADFPDTIETIQSLATHPAFSLTTPNKVRALYGAFCQQNLAQFHAISGKGYQLISDIVSQLDTINPSMAARLVTPLTQWRRFDEARQTLMKQSLSTLLENSAISNDLYEVVSKSLANR